jgi:hypothetical protein
VLLHIIVHFPHRCPKLRAAASAITPLPSNVDRSIPQPWLVFVFDIVKAVVFLSFVWGERGLSPDFHESEQNGNKPSTNQGVPKALG